MALSLWQHTDVVEDTEQKYGPGWNDVLQKEIDKLDDVFDGPLYRRSLVPRSLLGRRVDLVNKMPKKTTHLHDEPVGFNKSQGSEIQ